MKKHGLQSLKILSLCYSCRSLVVLAIGSFKILRNSEETSEIGFEKMIRNIKADDRKTISHENCVFGPKCIE